MPLISSTGDIKYTFVSIDEDELNQIYHDSEEFENYEGIGGFVRDGKFWYRTEYNGGLEQPEWECQGETHWTFEIIANYSGCMLLLEGPPNDQVNRMATLMALDKEYFVTSYDTWATSVGQVAVVTETSE